MDKTEKLMEWKLKKTKKKRKMSVVSAVGTIQCKVENDIHLNTVLYPLTAEQCFSCYRNLQY